MPYGQVPTVQVTVNAIMRSAAFRRGVAEARAGQPPRYDQENDWEYERGQWAIVAPLTMPLMIGNKLNPNAIHTFYRSDIP
jgi:hypothetical protein